MLWWSAFTALTGAVTSCVPLLLTRFFFGMGEAGAFPDASVAVARWFPVHERGRAFGITMSEPGGRRDRTAARHAVQSRADGVRRSTCSGLSGSFGVVWCWWFRDSPAEKRGVSLSGTRRDAQPGSPCPPCASVEPRAPLSNLWAVMGIAFCCDVTRFVFLSRSWFHTYLVRARGFDESALWLSSLPFLVGACANCAGGFVSHGLVRMHGLEWGRRSRSD